MAQQNIIIGPANGGLGDNYFDAFTKTQDNFDELYAATVFTKRVLVNSLADFPAPASNIITLASNTKYLLANDIDFITNSLAFGDNTVLAGLDTIVTTATYTGAVPFLNMVNVSTSVKAMNILHPNADIISFSDSSNHVIRVDDVTTTGRSVGLLTGTNSLGRFTNFSPNLTTGGVSFAGNWTTFLFDASFGTIAAGIYVDLGTATFNGLALSRPSIVLQLGATYLSGLPNSGNVNAGGGATVISGSFFGAGTVLSGVTNEDALWEFFHNNQIQDTRPDALLSLQGNLVPEIIVAIGVPVKVIGNNTWIDERSSQSTSDNTGKSTYNGGKPVVVPITMRATIEPDAGKDRTISIYTALNGVPIVNSVASASVSAGKPGSVTSIWQSVALTGDFVEMYISNDETADDVLVSSAIIRIN